MQHPDVTTVLWDWNGTLFNDAWLCHDVMNTTLKQRNMPELSFEAYLDVFTFPVIEYYRRLGFDFEQEPFEVVGAEFIAEYERRRTEARLREDALACLESVRGRGLQQCILSAYQTETLESLTTHFDIRSYFDHVAGHRDIYAHGKVPQGRWLLEQLDAQPANMVLIGDTVHDAEVAAELGIGCRLVAGGNQPRCKLEAIGVPVFDSLTDVLSSL